MLCINIFLIPIASSVLNQYFRADRCTTLQRQFFCEVVSCFEKEVTSFYRNYSFCNSRNSCLSVNRM